MSMRFRIVASLCALGFILSPVPAVAGDGGVTQFVDCVVGSTMYHVETYAAIFMAFGEDVVIWESAVEATLLAFLRDGSLEVPPPPRLPIIEQPTSFCDVPRIERPS